MSVRGRRSSTPVPLRGRPVRHARTNREDGGMHGAGGVCARAPSLPPHQSLRRLTASEYSKYSQFSIYLSIYL